MTSSMRYAFVRQMGSEKDPPKDMKNCAIIGITCFSFPQIWPLSVLYFKEKVEVETAATITAVLPGNSKVLVQHLPVTKTIWASIEYWEGDPNHPQIGVLYKMDVTRVIGITPEEYKERSIVHWVLDEISKAEYDTWAGLKVVPVLFALSAG